MSIFKQDELKDEDIRFYLRKQYRENLMKNGYANAEKAKLVAECYDPMEFTMDIVRDVHKRTSRKFDTHHKPKTSDN